jgi:hypothetical protein
MERIRVAALIFAIATGPARADTVADWNRIALDAAAKSGQPLEYKLRAMAMVHVAMFETLNFIHGRYDPHFIARSPKPLDGMSIEAAVAAAAYHVLVDLYPYQRPEFAATLKSSVHAAPGNQLTANGVAAGTRIGAAICAARASDGSRPQPWLLKSAGALRPQGSTAPQNSGHTQDDDESASIPHDTGPQAWNTMTLELIASRELSPIERARIHALVWMVIADAYTAAEDAGYPCGSCVASAAVTTILESELGARLAPASARSGKADEDMGRKIGRYALLRYRIAPLSRDAR